MRNNIALFSIIASLAGCAATAGTVDRQQPQLDTVEQRGPENVVVRSEAPATPAPTELTLAAVDEAGRPIDVRACRMLSRNTGDFTGGRIADSRDPGCGDTSDGRTRLAVDSRSEIILTVGSLRVPGYPTYATQVTTDTEALDLSRAPLRLLDNEHIQGAYEAAGTARSTGRSRWSHRPTSATWSTSS